MSIFFWRKDNEVNAQGNENYKPYEEISEKKTTKLGYILLIGMVILGVQQGQNFISSLAGDIKEPQQISSCGRYLMDAIEDDTQTPKSRSSYGYEYGSYYGYSQETLSDCQYSDLEKKYSIGNIMNEIKPALLKGEEIENQLKNLKDSLYDANRTVRSAKENYSISLQEKMAQEGTTVYDKNQVKDSLSVGEQEIVTLEAKIKNVEGQLNEINRSISAIATKNATAINNVFDEYSREVKFVAFERALLMLVLISPALFFSARKYFRYKKENSQYTIIWAAVSSIFAILFAEVFFSFIYKIIPHKLLAALIEFFGQFSFLVTIAYYLLFLAVPAIFGGLVYWIQKRVYNKEAVMMRALKKHTCPNCSMLLRNEDNFCPVCHFQIKETCGKCNGKRIRGLKFCPVCGDADVK